VKARLRIASVETEQGCAGHQSHQLGHADVIEGDLAGIVTDRSVMAFGPTRGPHPAPAVVSPTGDEPAGTLPPPGVNASLFQTLDTDDDGKPDQVTYAYDCSRGMGSDGLPMTSLCVEEWSRAGGAWSITGKLKICGK
jgi:hypothetical protein